MDTTYVNRANTNDRVFQVANDRVAATGQKKKVDPFSVYYARQKLLWFQDLLSVEAEDPVRNSTMDANTLQARQLAVRRVGRPRLKWLAETTKEYWEATTPHRPAHLRRTAFVVDTAPHRQALIQTAQDKVLAK